MRATTVHAKSDSEVTSLEASSPPRSPPRRALYYVESPSHHELEKMSYNSSPINSPTHQHYHYRSSPIHHSRESSTSRFSSASLKYPYNHNNAGHNKHSVAPWKKMRRVADEEGEDDESIDDDGSGQKVRMWFCIGFGFVLLFMVFSLILWGASKGYRPQVFVKRIVFQNFHIQAGMDFSGVATELLTLNSTVVISYHNKGTFFGVHVSSTPLDFYCYQLKVASGQMRKFYQKRKGHQNIATEVSGHQVPVYGAVWALKDAKDNGQNFALPLNLTFVVRSRAYILGKLVKSKFYNNIKCSVTLKGSMLGKPLNLTDSCLYR